MKEVIKDEYLAWLAQYFVMKRVSIEPNFHQLYSNFLDGLKIAKLTKFVHEEVFRNITVVLIRSFQNDDCHSDCATDYICPKAVFPNLFKFDMLLFICATHCEI